MSDRISETCMPCQSVEDAKTGRQEIDAAMLAMVGMVQRHGDRFIAAFLEGLCPLHREAWRKHQS